eukprot:g3290.t2
MSLLLCTWNLGCKNASDAPKDGDYDWLAKIFKEMPACDAVTAEHCGSYLPLLLFQRNTSKVEVVPLHFTFDKHQVCSKGCVAAQFHFGGLQLCVVNAHLEAGHSKVNARNQMMAQIASHFPTPAGSLLLLLGDLNYRLEGQKPFTEPTKATPERCQLRRLREAGQVEFEEAEVCFHPTRGKPGGAKASADPVAAPHGASEDGAASAGSAELPAKLLQLLERGPERYKRVKASESDVKQGIPRFDLEQPRMPGWCDRIMWRRGADVEVKVLDYSAIEAADHSDHRPVYAVIEARPAG